MKAVIQTKEISAKRAMGPCVGVLTDIDTGTPIVDYDGNELGPLRARTSVVSGSKGDTVILLFDRGDIACPIIIGVVRDRFESAVPERLKLIAQEVVLEGIDEISLRCGESSLLLRKDGKTVLKGREVLSRASRTNRIRGSTVQVN